MATAVVALMRVAGAGACYQSAVVVQLVLALHEAAHCERHRQASAGRSGRQHLA